jgi:hypothetical protein
MEILRQTLLLRLFSTQQTQDLEDSRGIWTKITLVAFLLRMKTLTALLGLVLAP